MFQNQTLCSKKFGECLHAEEHVATLEFTGVHCPSSWSLTLDCLLALTTAQIEQRHADSLRALALQELARPPSSSPPPVGGSPISFRVAPPVSPQDGQPVPAPRRIASLCSAHGPCSAGPTFQLIDILLPFLLSYQRHCLPAHRRNIPGLIRRREFSHLYHNSWDLRPYVTSLQQRHMGSRLFRPQSCRCLRTSRRPAPSSALWLNPASLGSCVGGGLGLPVKRSRDTYSDPSFPSPSPVKKRKKKPPRPTESSSRTRPFKTARSPDPRPLEDDVGKRSRISPSSYTCSPFTLTPSQSPGPTRALEEIRVDPRIPHQGLLVGIAPTLLPFDGEGLFTKQDIFFPRYDARGRTKKWPIPDLIICEYLGRKVRHSQVISSSYTSAYVCALNNGWDIDAEEYTSCYGRFVNDNFADM